MGVALATVAAGVLTFQAMTAQAATAGCSASYVVSTQWSSGFSANVTITNLGDAVNGWRLTWSFTAGQAVTQAWNATVTQSGAAVTAADAGYNAAIATGGVASFGFNGSWNNASNPAPGSFALNGVTCAGVTATTPGATPSAVPTTSPVTSPTAKPTPTASASALRPADQDVRWRN